MMCCMRTPLSTIYNSFFTKITDDMYMEMNMVDTYKIVQELFVSAVHMFEFPRFDLYDYDLKRGCYNIKITPQEINIIATYMVVEWLGQQLASVENTRMKYSGPDFKFTSQANHMSKLQTLKADYQRMGFHLQRLYKRRAKDGRGIMRSTLGIIMAPLKEQWYPVAPIYNEIKNPSGSNTAGCGTCDKDCCFECDCYWKELTSVKQKMEALDSCCDFKWDEIQPVKPEDVHICGQVQWNEITQI